MHCVLPAVLARDEADFYKRIAHPHLRPLAPEWHIDVLDGSMFDATCWADPAVIGTWNNLPNIELHLMVHNPLPCIDAWQRLVPTLRRAIVHLEIARPLGAVLEHIRHLGLETGLALNPETKLERAEHLVPHLDVLQIMGIHPGASGRPFHGDPIYAKIRRAKKLFPPLPISVDGGVSLENASDLLASGVERLVTASALWSSADPAKIYQQLVHLQTPE